MPQRTCVACARPIDVSRRADARTCDQACASWARRHPGVPRTGQPTYVCKHCESTFERRLAGGKRPRFCGVRCYEADRHAQRPFGEWRKTEPFKPRDFTCEDCGHHGQDKGIGPIPRRCPDCAARRTREKSLQWQRDNQDVVNARRLAWAKANPAKVRATLAANRDKYSARQREYVEENHDRVREWKRNRESRRRARKLSLPVEIFRAVDVFERDDWVCGICHEPVDPALRWPDGESPSLDHIVPLSRGGSHSLDNVQLAHLLCNIRKGASQP